MSLRSFPFFVALFLISVTAFAAQAPAANPEQAKPEKPIPVKVVIVAMFEVGADTGDAPGELQFWVERDHLDRVYPLAAGYHAARMNGDGEMAILTGQGTAHAAATIMALGLDPRFDLSHAYWIIAGIAGASPDRASLGSAVWARWVVDGDLAYELDAREIPAGWTTGFVPLHKSRPFQAPVEVLDGQVFALNPDLAAWAFQLTKDTPLADSDRLRQTRLRFDGAAAQKPPFVTMGDELSSSTYWHGNFFDAWAAEWVAYYTGGKGRFATTAMEDSGTLQSLQFLAKAGRVDFQRVMVLRTVSNYDRQPRGLTAAESLESQRVGTSGAFLPSLESAYAVGHAVANELETHWQQYERSGFRADQNAFTKP
jgi:purine nucleoside permease